MHAPEYDLLKKNLARGWNTWNVRSVMSHVLLPAGLALNLAIQEYASGAYLKEALIGRQGKDDEAIHPGLRSYDGSYTELQLTWRTIVLEVQSTTDGDDLLLLITPKANQLKPCTLVLETGFLWNRPGYFHHSPTAPGTITAYFQSSSVTLLSSGTPVSIPHAATQSPYIAVSGHEPVAFSTGKKRTVAEAQQLLAARREALIAARAHAGELAEVYAATQTCLAWDTIYDPSEDRVISPVSRVWSVGSGGFVLFCWDNYFAGYIAALENRAIAYSNVIEITRTVTDDGFVPNYTNGSGLKSLDRSQPCVGSLMVRELYRKFREKWLLEMLFEALLRWNRWWHVHRRSGNLLAWGSTPFKPRLGNFWETTGVNETYGAALESGLDNSPMYDEIPFNKTTHLLELHDVGLNSLYVADCDALADIADVLGRTAESAELRARGGAYRAALADLWDDSFGVFLNRRTDTGEFSKRLSPTHFYPLLAKAASPVQAERIINEHFMNAVEFFGPHMLPSIARNDPRYPEQDYWRGRIWAPMNFLVYLGLRNYPLAESRTLLATRSMELLMREWRAHGHVHENYGGDSGLGCDKPNSDRFYHWGALLGTIGLIEAGHYAPPEGAL